MKQKLLSLAEITEIERAYSHGAPTLGVAAKALLGRWQAHLRDDETFLRLAFFRCYQVYEPDWLTGLDSPLPDVDALIAEKGGEASLSAEALFTLAMLLKYCPFQDDKEGRAEQIQKCAEQAGAKAPQSLLFRDWKFFLGQAPTTDGVKLWIELEIHARFGGRGAFGHYLEGLLDTIIKEGRNPSARNSN